MWFAILLSVGAVAIGLFFGLRQGKVNNQLLDEGRIVKRKYVITEQAEEFTLRGADFARVLQGIQDADLRGSGVSVQRNDTNQAFFCHNCFFCPNAVKARLHTIVHITFHFTFQIVALKAIHSLSPTFPES